MESMEFVGNTYHNNIGPSVFRLTTDGRVVVDSNFFLNKLNSIRLNLTIYLLFNGQILKFLGPYKMESDNLYM